MSIQIHHKQKFEARHNGSQGENLQSLLDKIGVENVEELIQKTIPEKIRLSKDLQLPKAKSEQVFLKDFKALAQKNKVFKSYIGMGYYDCFTPNVILRNILENPGWYTAYTPYQAEIAQGRLEALINFQTTVIDLTGMEIANASLLDEGTAAAEAMTMLYGTRNGKKKKANTIFISELCHPQTIEVLKTRATPLDIKVLIGNHQTIDLSDENIFAIVLQYPATNGEVFDYTAMLASAKELGITSIIAADLLSLIMLKSPGKMGADVVVGSTQRFGVPMGYGGPHAAYFATSEKYKRQMPGRIIGVSVDSQGNKAYRMALQTREQHIRREKATSNICTAQVLLGVIAGMYAVYQGPEGLKEIAERVYGLTSVLKKALEKNNFEVLNKVFFDTITINTSKEISIKIREKAEANFLNFRYYENGNIGISLDETTSLEDIKEIASIFSEGKIDWENLTSKIENKIPENLQRKSEYLIHPVFHNNHSEHAMLRYMKSLENKDLSLVHSMIPLGSCTMKLNATTEMIPLTWREFGGIHPFVPQNQAQGYAQIFGELETWLCEITGFAGVSLQPNSGAQGEYAGLMVIRNYHHSRGESHRNIALIPSSAHGTNPASAVMAGMKVVVVACDERGNIDIPDLKAKAEKHKENLSSLMVTYPSTHGVFEEGIQEICEIVHQHGGQVYMDGANMNAQVALTSPAQIGADVCHLNLHKTFCIPHGGGGPGMGPIGVAKHLVPFLPNHSVVKISESESTAVSAAPWGSASILTISYAYIAMMGAEGLKKATELSIVNANYIKTRLEKDYKILYTGENGFAAHEFIIDCRDFKKVGIEVADIAKRLMDYGFHAPTVSFPVAGTMMIEPTESETKEELDRFCDALLAIRAEIKEVEDERMPQSNNVVVNAPHTAQMLLNENWDKPYTREKAAYPLPYLKNNKFWTVAAKIDNAYGDRNLICSCIPIEEYAEQSEELAEANNS